jgi:hypothetical protein
MSNDIARKIIEFTGRMPGNDLKRVVNLVNHTSAARGLQKNQKY